MNRDNHLLVLILAVGISGAALSTSIFDDLYPAFPGFVLGTALSILVLQWHKQDFSYRYLIAYITLSVFYRLFIFIYPNSYIGKDSDGFAFSIARILEYDTINVLEVSFYSRAPVYHVTAGIATLITGGEIKIALVFIPILIGILYPTFAFLLPRYLRVPKPDRTASLAAALLVLAPASTALTSNPIAQSQAVLVALTSVLLIGLYILQSRHVYVLIALFCFFVITITHKLSPFLIASGLVTTSVYFFIVNRYRSTNSIRTTISTLAVTSIGLVYLQIYSTEIISIILPYYIFDRVSPVTVSPMTSSPVAEQVFQSGLYIFTLKVGYLVVFLLLAGIGWVWLLIRERNHTMTLFVLALVPFGVTLALATGSFLGVINGSQNRFLLLILPMLAVLCATIITVLLDHDLFQPGPVTRAALVILLISIFVGQAFSPVASPDPTTGPRTYITQSEIDAKVWGHDHIDSSVVTDDFYARMMPPSKVSTFAGQGPKPPSKYIPGTDILLSSTNRQIQHCTVLVRQSEMIYLVSGIRWRLTRPLVDKYLGDNRVYDSGMDGSVFFRSTKCS